MCASVACFTVNSLLLKHFSDHLRLDPSVSLIFRFVIGLLLCVVVFGPSGKLRLAGCFTKWLLFSRGMLGVFSTAAFYYSVGPLGAGKAVLIGNTWTLFSALLAAWMLKEALSPSRLVSIVAALIGLALLLGVGPAGLGHDWEWELIQLAGALMAAGVVVIIRELTRTETSATIFASQCVYGFILCLPFAWSHLAGLSLEQTLWALAAGTLAALGQWTMTEAFRFLPVAVGGGFQVTVPLFIAVGGVILFQEQFTQWQIVGGVLILLGSFLTVGAKSKT
jgi:drug/metabolite transporter (DMT)-like permease